jgi:predicted short-subunit dehydrogenase-like oxidoreductase (DUF2520 family)
VIVAGRGRLGRSLAGAVSAAGSRVQLVSVRSSTAALVRAAAASPRAIALLAVPDDAVPGIAARIARVSSSIPETVSFVHVSGALDLAPLAPLRRSHGVGSFHPLQSFPALRPPSAFRGITVAIDAGTPGLLLRLGRLARDLGAQPVRVVGGQRVLYHAAAVFASNYIDVMIREAVALLVASGWKEKDATAGLLPLVAGAVENVRKRGPVNALTGPIRRGDTDTVRRHLAALRRLDHDSAAVGGQPFEVVYRMLGRIALEIAEEAGLDPAAAGRMRRALTREVAATRRRRR